MVAVNRFVMRVVNPVMINKLLLVLTTIVCNKTVTLN